MSRSWIEMTFTDGVSRLHSLELRLTNGGMVIESDFGSLVVEDPEAFGLGRGPVCWRNLATNVLLLGSQLTHVLYAISLPEQQVREADVLLRDDDEDLRFLSVSSGDNGFLLTLYERGLVCIDADGLVRWHRLHDDLSARLVGVEGGVAILETQWPPQMAGARKGFRLDDGEEVPLT